jgi:hypothetical protein
VLVYLAIVNELDIFGEALFHILFRVELLPLINTIAGKYLMQLLHFEERLPHIFLEVSLCILDDKLLDQMVPNLLESLSHYNLPLEVFKSCNKRDAVELIEVADKYDVNLGYIDHIEMAKLELGGSPVNKVLSIYLLVELLTLGGGFPLFVLIQVDLLVECCEIRIRHRLKIAITNVHGFEYLAHLFLLLHDFLPLRILGRHPSLLLIVSEVEISWEIPQYCRLLHH